MGWKYEIDTVRRAIFSIHEGVVNDEDLLERQRIVAADPDFDPSLSQLADFSGATEILVSSEGVRALAEANLYSPESKRAFVAPSDLQYGIARMFQILRDDRPETIQIFRTREEAVAWLDLG